MLGLTRRPGETTRIGKDITVTVIAVKRDQVHIGIKAPADVTILRKELLKRRRIAAQATGSNG